MSMFIIWLCTVFIVANECEAISGDDNGTNSICNPNPCLNGICIESNAEDLDNAVSYRCFCYNGYTGNDCSVNFDECLAGRNQCQNNATCVNDVPEIRCICPKGFCGKYCELQIDECQSNPCFNGATCVDKLNDYECICLPGYTGLRCENDVDFCDINILTKLNKTSHCENGGSCKDGPGEEYFCVCQQGFTGSRCESVINECDSSPCSNGGRCVKHSEGFQCVCPYGWTGTTCEIPLKKCSGENRCQNNAFCMESLEMKNEFYCYCPPDYHGKFCELRFDECEPNVCQNGATCIDQINGYNCACLNGFVGKLCEINCSDTNQTNELCLVSNATQSIDLTSVLQTSFVEPTSPYAQSTASAMQTLSPELSDNYTISSLFIHSTIIDFSLMNYSTEIPDTSLFSVSTSEVLISPTPTVGQPEVVPQSVDVENLRNIFSPNFNGIDSRLVFKVRRVKRMSSSVQMSIVSENDDGTILYARTNKYHLVIYLENLLVVVQLSAKQNLLRIQSSVPIALFKQYTIKLSMASSIGSLYAELNIFSGDSLIHSISNQKSNLTVPCFENYELGQSPSNVFADSNHFQAFKGCIFDFAINDEEKFVKDSVQVANISECLSNVCEQNPCRNGAMCQNNSSQINSWSCTCTDGYRGWLCQETYCHSNFCFNGGLCLLENQNKHLCVCALGFYGPRCEFKLNLTFPLFNVGSNNSFIKYKLPYDLLEFFEIRFRFIAHDFGQDNGLLMFMSQISNDDSRLPTSSFGKDFVSLIYEQQTLVLRLNLGQGEKMLRAATEANITEQMVLFGRYKQVFWLLVVPSPFSQHLVPQVGRTPLHHNVLNVDPYLYVGGHEDWNAHPALYNVTGFKGCIYDIDIRVSRNSNFTRIDETLIDNMANIDQCDFECT